MSDPGVYRGLSVAEYDAIPALRSSELRKFRDATPAHYAYRSKQEQPDTPAFAFGRELHMAILEPERFAAHVGERPAMPTAQDLGFKDFRTAAAREARDAAAADIASQIEGKEFVLSTDDRNMVLEMASSLLKDLEFGDLMQDDYETELTLVWECEDTGILRKARLDIWLPKTRQVIELKGTRVTATPEKFRREIQKFGYVHQTSYYLDGVRAELGEPHKSEPVIMGVGEKFPPYLWAVRPVDLASLLTARCENSTALLEYAKCVRSGHWPGHDPCVPWSLSGYSEQEVGLTFAEDTEVLL